MGVRPDIIFRVVVGYPGNGFLDGPLTIDSVQGLATRILFFDFQRRSFVYQ